MENPVQRYLDKHPDDAGWRLAQRSGLAIATVYKILRGKTRCIQSETMAALVAGSSGKIRLVDLQAYNMEQARQ